MDKSPDSPDELTPIDLQTALVETESLSCVNWRSAAYSWIIFYNQKNLNSVSILRVRDDVWQLETPVFCDDVRCCFKHMAQVDTRRLVDIIRMFFEGDDWYGMARFWFDDQMYEFELQNPDL